MSFGDGSGTDFATARGRDWPSVRQFNVFLENRVGALLDLVRRFESASLRVISLTVVDSADCAIIRIVVNDPERGVEVLQQAELPFNESDLLVVQLPDVRQPLISICKALLAGEINIHYAYPLLVNPQGTAALALHVEDHESALNTLSRQGFTVLTENDLDFND